MRNFTHYVVANHANTHLNYVAPFSGNRDLQPYPQRMVQWGCAGPCLVAWGRNIVPRSPLPDELFLRLATPASASRPIGQWFKKRREI
jgi:hypothetical protein